MKTKTMKPKVKIRMPDDRPKRKKVKTDDDEPVKKKKKVSTELAVLGSDQLPKINKKAIKTYFGKHAKGIMHMLEMNDNDGGLTLLQKKLLQTTISLVPYAESIIRNTKSQRGIYQYTALVNQVREIMTDIRSNEDRRHVAQTLLTYVIQPVFIDLAQKTITEHHDFKRVAEKYINPKDSQKFSSDLQQVARNLAREMQAAYKELEVKITEQLKT